MADYLANVLSLDLAGNIAISDTAANIASGIDTLNTDTHVSSITLLGSANLDLDVAQALNEYGAAGFLAEPDYTLTAASTPNSANFNQQWALQNTGQNGGTDRFDRCFRGDENARRALCADR